MSKKILEVEGDANRDMHQNAGGRFYSAHKSEDIDKWLRHKDADTDLSVYDEIFGTDGDWWDGEPDNDLMDCNFSYYAKEDVTEDECEFDEEIQEFLDEEPKRERVAGIRRVNYQLKDLIGNIDGIKDTTIQLFNDFKKVVKTDDVENLPEEEKKLYQTLNDMTQLTLKYPKPEVKKETYEPF